MTITEAKILNAIKYFVGSTKGTRLTKLFKLLYFLDFMYFKERGLSVTLYDYYTYDFGPVPEELYDQITNGRLPAYLKEDLSFVKMKSEKYDTGKYEITVRKKSVDFEVFSPHEKRMLLKVAEIFQEADAATMTEASHLKNSPWHVTVSKKGMHQKIDYLLAHDDESNIDAASMQEYLSLQRALKTDGRL